MFPPDESNAAAKCFWPFTAKTPLPLALQLGFDGCAAIWAQLHAFKPNDLRYAAAH
jgi:hypothetical protein